MCPELQVQVVIQMLDHKLVVQRELAGNLGSLPSSATDFLYVLASFTYFSCSPAKGDNSTSLMVLGRSLETEEGGLESVNILLSKRNSRLELSGSAAVPQSNYIKYLKQ